MYFLIFNLFNHFDYSSSTTHPPISILPSPPKHPATPMIPTPHPRLFHYPHPPIPDYSRLKRIRYPINTSAIEKRKNCKKHI